MHIGIGLSKRRGAIITSTSGIKEPLKAMLASTNCFVYYSTTIYGSNDVKYQNLGVLSCLLYTSMIISMFNESTHGGRLMYNCQLLLPLRNRTILWFICGRVNLASKSPSIIATLS